jgi:hypothetical protein
MRRCLTVIPLPVIGHVPPVRVMALHPLCPFAPRRSSRPAQPGPARGPAGLMCRA